MQNSKPIKMLMNRLKLESNSNEKLYKDIKKIKWGIAGCGRFAENSFLPAV